MCLLSLMRPDVYRWDIIARILVLSVASCICASAVYQGVSLDRLPCHVSWLLALRRPSAVLGYCVAPSVGMHSFVGQRAAMLFFKRLLGNLRREES